MVTKLADLVVLGFYDCKTCQQIAAFTFDTLAAPMDTLRGIVACRLFSVQCAAGIPKLAQE